MAVCEKTFRLYAQPPYREQFIFIDPAQEVPAEDAQPMDCRRDARRDPRETKGADYHVTTEASAFCCEPGSCC
jgi:hypothetical protein